MKLKTHSIKSNIPHLASKLTQLLEQHQTNSTQVAQALGIPMMTIRRLVSGETTDPRISTLKLLAGYFNVSLDSLLDDENLSPPRSLNQGKPFFVPLLSWEILSGPTDFKEIDLTNWHDWQPISLSEQDQISNHAFALESRPSMYPRFPFGTIFIFEPNIQPEDGDIVLVKINDQNELTLRELVIDAPDWQLQPIIPGSNMIFYQKKLHTILGINIFTLLYNRKT